MIGFMPNAVAAETFSNADILAWESTDRNNWLEGAVLMANHMVHLSDPEKAACIWDWYVLNPITARDEIFTLMRGYPDSSPTSVLISLMQNACGTPLVAAAQ